MSFSAKHNLLRAIRFEHPEHVPYAGEGAYCLLDYAGRRPPREGVDEWGVQWAPLPSGYRAGAGEPAHSYPVAYPAQSAAELVRLAFPGPPDPAGFSRLLDGIDSYRTLAVGRHPAGLFDRFLSLLGPVQGMMSLLDEPEASLSVLERIADYHVAVARGYLRAGVEAGWLADDYAGQTGPLIGLPLWRRMILPGLLRVIAVYREAGAPVFFHTCGQAGAFIPYLLDAGVTAFNLESAACDLAALRVVFGNRISFAGGISADLLLHGTVDDVRHAACAAMKDLGRDGGLVLSADQDLAFPAANEAALSEVARRDGHYPLCI